jgi:hypothetical protein
MTQPRVTQDRVDVDGYPTRCCRCGKPIVKARHDSQHHHQAGTNTSWHTTCTTAAPSGVKATGSNTSAPPLPPKAEVSAA